MGEQVTDDVLCDGNNECFRLDKSRRVQGEALKAIINDMGKLAKEPAPWVSIAAVKGWMATLEKLI